MHNFSHTNFIFTLNETILCDSAFSAVIISLTLVIIWQWYIKLLDAHNLLHVHANISISIDTLFSRVMMKFMCPFNQNINEHEHTHTLSFYLADCVQEEEVEGRSRNIHISALIQSTNWFFSKGFMKCHTVWLNVLRSVSAFKFAL